MSDEMTISMYDVKKQVSACIRMAEEADKFIAWADAGVFQDPNLGRNRAVEALEALEALARDAIQGVDRLIDMEAQEATRKAAARSGDFLQECCPGASIVRDDRRTNGEIIREELNRA